MPGELKGDALVNYEILLKMNSSLCSIYNVSAGESDVLFKRLKNIKGKALIIDALLGSGIKGEVKGLYKDVIENINLSKRKNLKLDVVSVDVPSGLGMEYHTYTIIDSCHTVTMGAIKTNLLFGSGKENSGQLYVVPIGITNDCFERVNIYSKFLVEESDVKGLLLKRKKK